MINQIKSADSLLQDLKILVVDDSVDIREMLSMILKANGADVHTAMDSAEAIGKANSLKFDVILMDILMPGLDGKDTASQIKILPYRKKIIALSGFIDTKKVFEEMASPFDAYIMKPVSPEELLQKIVDGVKC